MPKKKRLFLILAVLLAIAAGVYADARHAAAGLAAIALVMGTRRLLRLLRAHGGLRELAGKCSPYQVGALVSRAKAAERAGAPFTFVVLGDNRATKTVPPEIHRLVRGENPALLFNTGDLARHGTAREYAERYVPLLEIMDPVPVFSVPGNHDRGARNDFAGYRAVHGEERFSFDYGPCRFVGVNNGKRARMTADDIAFLRRELSKSPVRHKFVFIHIPPTYFEDGLVTTSKRRGFVRFRDEFRALMAEQRVDEVFMGHIHGYASRVIDGVRYTLTAGAGAPLSKRLPREAQTYNYVVCRVDGEGYRREVVQSIGGKWERGDQTAPRPGHPRPLPV